MSFELSEDETPVYDFCGICPQCGNVMTFIHDIRCMECDNRRIMWCPSCLKHRKLKL